MERHGGGASRGIEKPRSRSGSDGKCIDPDHERQQRDAAKFLQSFLSQSAQEEQHETLFSPVSVRHRRGKCRGRSINSSDMPDNTGPIALIELTGPTETN